ncbi:PD-(D/E)XK nuclease family protein [Congregibacter variabilis]|uniref:PD-(D/E)XK nuclease family protein n=1 Tax=Congregibacter variabilis TaxID=3081200 RepID=A0ABZ0I5N3_9GAMM|nr:PD-(D/E)XK nuclease family protein [Congregibacter sp. IMCC43200]
MSLRPLFAGIEDIAELLESGTAVLTPNRRLSRAVGDAQHQYRLTKGDQVWPSSSILPLRQFWIERWRHAVTRGLIEPKVLVDAAAQRLIWRKVIDADEAVPFSLLSPSRAANLCQEASETLALWRINLDDKAVRQSFSFDEDSRAFLRWESRFREVLLDLDAVTPEQALEELLTCPDALGQSVALLSQDDLPPLHQALCEASPTWQQLTLPHRTAQLLPTRAFSDPAAELQMAARWCREQHERDPLGRYAVVLSDMHSDRDRLEYYLRKEFDCLTQDYASLPVNFATGFTLDRVPLVRDALRILEFSLPEVAVESVIAVLQSRFIKPLTYRKTHRERCIRRLRDLAKERIPQRVMRSVLDDLLDKEACELPWDVVLQLETNGSWHRRPRTPSQWLEPFRAILSAWGWSRGATLDSLEYQQAVQWQEALDSFATQDLFAGALTLPEAIQSLRELLSEQQFQPRTEDQAIQVLGPLETTGLRFDAMWITGMSAERWPAAAQPNPYLPHGLQREQGMPHADAGWERRWAKARWDHWLAGAGEIQASYVNQRDGAEALPSPLIVEVPSKLESEDWTVDERWLVQASKAAFDRVVLNSVPLAKDERAFQGVGASVLEQQSACPFQAFSATRLQATQTPALTAGLLASERGTLLHRALYDVWGSLRDSTQLASITDAELTPVIQRALDYAQLGLLKERLDVIGGDMIALERQRLDVVLRRWLALERERTEEFVVTGREEPREHQLGDLRLRLRIDRVDRLSDGRELIIDYKSGAIGSIKQWLGERPARPQLPLYALLEPPAAGITYASLKPGSEGFKGIGEQEFIKGIESADKQLEDEQSGGMEALRHGWIEELTLLANEFVSGHSPVDPRIDACRYCQRFSLCRLGEELA